MAQQLSEQEQLKLAQDAFAEVQFILKLSGIDLTTLPKEQFELYMGIYQAGLKNGVKACMEITTADINPEDIPF